MFKIPHAEGMSPRGVSPFVGEVYAKGVEGDVAVVAVPVVGGQQLILHTDVERLFGIL